MIWNKTNPIYTLIYTSYLPFLQTIHKSRVKLINKPEESVPEEFYIFVNTNNAQTKHNIEKTNCIVSAAFLQCIEDSDKSFADKYLKGIISTFSPLGRHENNFTQKYETGNLEYLPFVVNQNCDLNFVSMFNNSITNDYTIEYNCEIHRRYNYLTYPSRLSSCYAFSDYESCIHVSEKYGWNINSVRKFKLIPHNNNRVAKVNMEIISLQRYAESIAMIDQENQIRIWESYWNSFGEIELELPTLNSGRRKFKSGVLWEYLVEGILMLS